MRYLDEFEIQSTNIANNDYYRTNR